MSNQAAYEEMCKKAEKYDALVKGIGIIKENIKTAQENIPESYHAYSYWRGLEQALDIVKERTEGLI